MTTVLVYCWKPIPIVVWEIQSPLAVGFIYAAYGLVWLLMVLATFQFGHFSFLGLAQAWQKFREITAQKSEGLATGLLYGLVRHPISIGWISLPLITPVLTVGHLVFFVGVLVYIMLATPFEEDDLIAELGDSYRDYRDKTPTYFPLLRIKNRRER